MEKIKELFGAEALTWEQFEAKLKDNKEVKIANLASGGYVDKKKFDDKVTELTTANDTIKGLRETISKFDGVDVDKLKKDAADWETKYNTDIEGLRLTNDVNMEIIAKKGKNPKLIMAALDMSKVKRDGEKILGLSEQLEALQKSDSYLFEEEPGGDSGARMNTGGHHSNNTNTTNFMASVMKYAGLDNAKE